MNKDVKVTLNPKNHYIMYTMLIDFGGFRDLFEEGERRMVFHRQSAFDTVEEVLAHFEDYCKQFPTMSYVVVSPKFYLEEPYKEIVAGLITSKTIYCGEDDWTRAVKKLSEKYNIIKERNTGKLLYDPCRCL